MKKSLLLLVLISLAFSGLPAFAEKFSSDDEEDIPVVTVQKRYFLKSNRYEVAANFGWIPNDTFVKSFAAGGSIGYHFNESFFVEVPAAIFLNVESDSTEFLQTNFGIQPDTDDLNFYASAHVGWSPIYGKLNFMSRQIVYFDSSLYIGAGVTEAEVSGLSPHLAVGVTERFVLTKWLALRLDFKDNIVLRDDTGVDSAIRHVMFINLGLSFFLPVK